MDKIKKSQVRKAFISPILNFGPFQWIIQIFPRGTTIVEDFEDEEDETYVYISYHLLSFPSTLKTMYLQLTLSTPENDKQLQSSIVYDPLYGEHPDIECNLLYGETDDIMNVDTLTLKSKMSIIDIFDENGNDLNPSICCNDISKYGNIDDIFEHSNCEDFIWNIDDDVLKEMKEPEEYDMFGSEEYEMKLDEIDDSLKWFMRIYPQHEYVKFELHSEEIPTGVDGIAAYFKVNIVELNREIKVLTHFINGYESCFKAIYIMKTDELRNLDQLTINVKLGVMNVFGNDLRAINEPSDDDMVNID